MSLTTADVSELYSASTTTAGTQIRLNDTPVTGGDVFYDFVLTPDGGRALFRGDVLTDGVTEVFSVSTTAAGTQIRVSSTPVASGDVYADTLAVTPDGSRVVYAGDMTTNGMVELYSASTTSAGAQVRLTNTPVLGGDVDDETPILVTADSSRVVYYGDLSTNGLDELYSASTTAAGTQIRLNDPPVGSQGVEPDYALTPDGSRVVYRGEITAGQGVKLYSASASAAGTQVTLSESSLSGSGVGDFQITPDSARVVYRAVLTTTGVTDLYVAPIGTSNRQRCLTELTEGQDVFEFQVTPDGRYVVYTIFPDGSSPPNSLYVLDLAGVNPPQLLEGPLGPSKQILQFRVSPDSRTVVYLADPDEIGHNELYSTEIPRPVGQLYWTVGTTDPVGLFRGSADGSGGVTRVYEGPVSMRPGGVALDDANAYWAASVSEAIYRGPRHGAGPVTCLFDRSDYPGSPGDANPQDVDLDDDFIYWTDSTTDQVLRGPKGGGSVEVLFESGDYPGSPPGDLEPKGVAVDGEWVYWADALSEQILCGAKGGSGSAVALFDTSDYPGSPGNAYPSGLAVDEGFVYWTDIATGEILRGRKDGTGLVELLFDAGDYPGSPPADLGLLGLTVDDVYVYWTDFVTGQILCGAKDGTGSAVELFAAGDYPGSPPEVNPQYIAIDPFPMPMPGDADDDGCIDGADYTAWADGYQLPGGWRDGDFNGDGFVDGADYTAWADNYGIGCGDSVPEPAAIVLFGATAGLLAGAGRVRRRRVR
jgi:Tol biopolymer transport system component